MLIYAALWVAQSLNQQYLASGAKLRAQKGLYCDACFSMHGMIELYLMKAVVMVMRPEGPTPLAN